MTNKQQEIINDNLRAYLNNFKPIKIVTGDSGKDFYVYEVGRDTWVQYCYNIHYLNGWLYGAVQSNNKVIRSIR